MAVSKDTLTLSKAHIPGEEWVKFPSNSLYSISNYGRVRNDETSRIMRLVAGKDTVKVQLGGNIASGKDNTYFKDLAEEVCKVFNKEVPIGPIKFLDGNPFNLFNKNICAQNILPNAKNNNWKPIPGSPEYLINEAGEVIHKEKNKAALLRSFEVDGHLFIDMDGDSLSVAELMVAAFHNRHIPLDLISFNDKHYRNCKLTNLSFCTQPVITNGVMGLQVLKSVNDRPKSYPYLLEREDFYVLIKDITELSKYKNRIEQSKELIFKAFDCLVKDTSHNKKEYLVSSHGYLFDVADNNPMYPTLENGVAVFALKDGINPNAAAVVLKAFRPDITNAPFVKDYMCRTKDGSANCKLDNCSVDLTGVKLKLTEMRLVPAEFLWIKPTQKSKVIKPKIVKKVLAEAIKLESGSALLSDAFNNACACVSNTKEVKPMTSEPLKVTVDNSSFSKEDVEAFFDAEKTIYRYHADSKLYFTINGKVFDNELNELRISADDKGKPFVTVLNNEGKQDWRYVACLMIWVFKGVMLKEDPTFKDNNPGNIKLNNLDYNKYKNPNKTPLDTILDDAKKLMSFGYNRNEITRLLVVNTALLYSTYAAEKLFGKKSEEVKFSRDVDVIDASVDTLEVDEVKPVVKETPVPVVIDTFITVKKSVSIGGNFYTEDELARMPIEKLEELLAIKEQESSKRAELMKKLLS